MSPMMVETYDRAVLEFDMIINTTKKNRSKLQSIMYRLSEQSITQRIREIVPKKDCAGTE